MNNTKRYRVLLGSLAFASSSAFSESRTITINPSLSVPKIGQGYLAESDELRSPCLSGSTLYIPRTEATIQLESALSEDEIKEDIAAQFASGINVFIASAKVINTLSSQLDEDSYRKTLLYKGSFRTGDEILSTPELNTLGKELVRIGDEKTSVANCGREFVQKVEHGGHLYISLEFSFRSKNIKNDITTRAEFEVLGIKKAKTFAKTIENYKSSVHIKVDAFQIGGRPERLQEILAAHPSKSCQPDTFEACDILLESLFDYATNPQEFPGQLGRSPLSFTTSAYKNFGFGRLVSESSPLLKAEQLIAYQELATEYAKNQNIVHTIRENIDSKLVTDAQRHQLYFAQDDREQNLTLLKRALKDCEAKTESCVTIRDATSGQIKTTDPSLLSPWRNFYYSCQLEDPQEKAGITYVLHQLGVHSCLEGFKNIALIRELDLRGLGLRKLNFLSTLTELEKLNISHNQLEDLYDLSTLIHLKELNAKGNRIESLDGIRNLKQLERVSVAKNHIRTLAPLAGLKQLKFLSAYDNILTDSPGAFFVPQATKILTFEEACREAAQKLVEQRKIDRDSAQIYQDMGFGPYFLDGQPLRWINCELASQSYDE